MEVWVRVAYALLLARACGRWKDRERLSGWKVTSTSDPQPHCQPPHPQRHHSERLVAVIPVAATDSNTMGKIIDAIFSPLVFGRYPLSILVVLLYGLVFSSVLFSDSLPRVNYSKGFDQALTDLTK